MTIPELAEELNRHSIDFKIGNLQEIRVKLHGLKRVPRQGIFGPQSIHDRYAFHLGCRVRNELQFNIGLEQREEGDMIRYGVAFSLETSQTLPSLEPMIPKIRRFNEYVTDRLENLPGIAMWHHDTNKGYLSEDRPVGQIPDELVKPGVFIMLGKRVAKDNVDVQGILAGFDSLLPLYYHVEGSEQSPAITMEPDFTPGCPDFIESTTARHKGQTVDVALRHQTLQMALYKHLGQEAGCKNVRMERHLNIGVSVDGVVLRNGKQTFYEVKVASSVRSCVRAALGQLIEYCHWPSADRASEMIVVGEAKLDSDSRAYLRLLRDRFGLPIWYRRIDMESDALEGKT